MKRFDEVVLKNEVAELSEKNIHLGCAGDVIGVDGTKCKVIFYSPRIYGDFAIVTVDESALEYKKQIDNCFVKSFEDFLKIVNESAHTRLLDDDVHEYDEIEMLVEKEKYVRHGVHKGMTGVVMEDTSYLPQQTGAERILQISMYIEMILKLSINLPCIETISRHQSPRN